MSGYLSRLAARAGGAVAAAAPRVQALFESAGLDGVAVEGDGSPRRAPEDRAAVRAAAETASAVDASGAARGRDLGDAPAALDGRFETTPSAAARRPAPIQTPRPEDPPGGAALPVPLRVAAPDPASASPVPAARVRDQESPSAGRREAPARATALPRVHPAAPSASTTTNTSPDVVHVTIGRVDVRASVTAPAPAPQPRPAPARRGPSLQDYLRGERAR